MLQGGRESATTWLVFGNTAPVMTDASDILPDDVETLRAQLTAALADHAAVVAERDAAVNERDAIRSERDQLEARNQRLESIIAEIRRAHFGRKSEKIDDNQLALALEELETSLAKSEAEADKAADEAAKAGKPATTRAGGKDRPRSRFPNLDHLPHVTEVIEPENKTCPCCGGALHVIGEDVSKRLDVVPAQLRVIETHRPKYACRSCETNGASLVSVSVSQASGHFWPIARWCLADCGVVCCVALFNNPFGELAS